MKIVTLMEDHLCGQGLIAEHGLSLYIETKKHKLLVDTGQSEKTWENAKVKGVDLSQIDTVILSHGHYDHSGGLMKFASINNKADLYMREDAGGEYYAFKGGSEQYIGIDKDILKLPNVHLLSGNTIIDEELSVFTGVKPNRSRPKGNKNLHEWKDNKLIQDAFSHEQYLVISQEDGSYALISGCAHNGILNILDAFRELYGCDPSIVISGFHMIQSAYSDEDLHEIRKTAAELSQMDTVFYSGHCTGEIAYEILKQEMGDKLLAIRDL